MTKTISASKKVRGTGSEFYFFSTSSPQWGPCPNLIGFVIKPKLGLDFDVGIWFCVSWPSEREERDGAAIRHFVSVSF